MSVSQRAGVVCQWCERVIQGGGEGLTLVTCLHCAEVFEVSKRIARMPYERSGSARELSAAAP